MRRGGKPVRQRQKGQSQAGGTTERYQLDAYERGAGLPARDHPLKTSRHRQQGRAVETDGTEDEKCRESSIEENGQGGLVRLRTELPPLAVEVHLLDQGNQDQPSYEANGENRYRDKQESRGNLQEKVHRAADREIVNGPQYSAVGILKHRPDRSSEEQAPESNAEENKESKVVYAVYELQFSYQLLPDP